MTTNGTTLATLTGAAVLVAGFLNTGVGLYLGAVLVLTASVGLPALRWWDSRA